jgi:xanthine dehydrogenase accessory factor
MDIFVEPVLPQPELIIIGNSPVSHALAQLAESFDFHTVIRTESSTDGAKVIKSNARQFIVVASQGKSDAQSLKQALAYGAEYVAFVGSRRKFAALVNKLAGKTCEGSALDDVIAPAGLHIDAVTPDEIALSILAQIVQLRRCGHRQQGGADV